MKRCDIITVGLNFACDLFKKIKNPELSTIMSFHQRFTTDLEHQAGHRHVEVQQTTRWKKRYLMVISLHNRQYEGSVAIQH